jgi:hypothetical protein
VEGGDDVVAAVNRVCSDQPCLLVIADIDAGQVSEVALERAAGARDADLAGLQGHLHTLGYRQRALRLENLHLDSAIAACVKWPGDQSWG